MKTKDPSLASELDTLLASPHLSAYLAASLASHLHTQEAAQLSTYLSTLSPQEVTAMFAYSHFDPDTDDHVYASIDDDAYLDMGVDGSVDTCGYAYLSMLDDRDR